MADTLAEQLTDLAGRVRRLSPDRHCPDRFFEERDEIRGDLERLAREQTRWPIA